MWDIVCGSPQAHRPESTCHHLFRQALQWSCAVRKRFRRDHCHRGRSKPGCRIVESTTKWELTNHRSWIPVFPPLTCDVYWIRVLPQLIPGLQSLWWWVKDIKVNWPTVMSNCFLHHLGTSWHWDMHLRHKMQTVLITSACTPGWMADYSGCSQLVTLPSAGGCH